MTRISRGLLLGLLLKGATALFRDVPTETSASGYEVLNVYVPRVTEAPSAHIELLRRDGTATALAAPNNTCGFVGGSSGQFSGDFQRCQKLTNSQGAPYSCTIAAESCILFLPSTAGPGRVGCCESVSDCAPRYACIEVDQFNDNAKCDDACKADHDIVKW